MLNLLPSTVRFLPWGETSNSQPDPAGRAYTSGLLGLTWLSVCVGILLMFDSFVLFGGKTIRTQDIEGFTYYGSMIYLPEREIPLYVVACALTVGLHAFLAWLWKRYCATTQAPERFATASGRRFGGIATSGLVVGTLLLFIVRHLFIRNRIDSGIGFLLLLTVPIAQLVLFFVQFKRLNRHLADEAEEIVPFPIFRPIEATEPLSPSSGSEHSLSGRISKIIPPLDGEPASTQSPNKGSHIPFVRMDVVAPILLFLMIFVPRPDLLIGHVFVNEHFHHWDFFLVGPAVGYAHGLALGTQTYAQYGVGWPVMLAKLSPILPLGYTNALWIGQIYCLVYYIGLYMFLRLLLQRPFLAAFGTLIALYWRHYAWLGNNFPIWELPQNSMLRTPFDVWFLTALLLHLRTERSRWLLVAGVTAGLSLLFETDNGIYLIFVLGLYNIYSIAGSFLRRAGDPTSTNQIGRSVLTATLAGVALVAVTLSGMAIASRGTLWHTAFWKGWLESFIAYPSGVSMLPVSAYRQGILYGMFQIGIYLFAVCYRRERYFENSTLPAQRLQLWIGLYGLCLAIHYIGRSHPNYLFESSLPLAILVVCATERLLLWADRRREQGYYTLPHLIYNGCRVFVGTIVILQLLNMRTYPSALHASIRQILKGERPHTARLFEHGAGGNLPWSDRGQADTYNALAQEIGNYARHGKQVAIISNDDTSLYLASGARPWSRYLPLLPNLVTKRQLNETADQLGNGTTDIVYIPLHDPCEMYPTWYPLVTTDAWLRLRDVTRHHYTLDHVSGPYEVYRR